MNTFDVGHFSRNLKESIINFLHDENRTFYIYVLIFALNCI